MLKSMTGFGSSERQVMGLGRISVEIRSVNHKFFELALHLPEGVLFLEERVRKEIEAVVKRGRVTCVVHILGSPPAKVFINERLLKDYLDTAGKVRKKFGLQDELSVNTLINLPGVFRLAEDRPSLQRLWPQARQLISQALGDLLRMRQKEGGALSAYLKRQALGLQAELKAIRLRFKTAVEEKAEKFSLEEERAAFLKSSDISEELERLKFHASNFINRLRNAAPVGKELDFIVQEMQRETNTLSAKSFDTVISGRAVRLKSHIEKLREQVQNVE
jgi:uncharacterized protein (TIGR00255 family)